MKRPASYSSTRLTARARSARVQVLVLGLTLALGWVATADAAQTASDWVPSVFLGDTAELTPHPDKDGLLIYRKAPGVLAGYEQVMIPTPLLYLDPEAAGRPLDPDDLQMLAEHLRSEVVEALEKEPTRYRVVDEAGPGVLVVRSAIVGVEPVDAKKNIGASAAGMALGVGLLVPRVDVGGAAIEVEMLDGATGERLVAVAASKEGRRMFGKIRGAKEWGDVKGAFKDWAKLFRKTLDRVNED